MAKSNIRKYYTASINDDSCGHAHKSFGQAEACAKKTIRAAQRGVKFYNSDYAKKLNINDAEQYVKSHLVAL